MPENQRECADDNSKKEREVQGNCRVEPGDTLDGRACNIVNWPTYRVAKDGWPSKEYAMSHEEALCIGICCMNGIRMRSNANA